MKRLLAAAAALAVFASLVWAQVFTGLLTGNELVNITLTNGSGAQITLAQVSSPNIATVAPTGGTITATNNVSTLVLTAALTTPLTINTPLTPFNGQIFTESNGTAIAFTQTITFTANPAAVPAQTVQAGAIGTEGAGASAEWQYNIANTTWYRIR